MKRIFIFGCHRSGTTLMRLILDSHPLIHCFDEWKSYDAVLNNNYENPKNAPYIGLKMPNWNEWIIESEYIKHYHNDPILFMIRDVRAVVASALTLPTGEHGERRFFDGILEAINVKWPIDKNRKFHIEEAKELEKLPYSDYRKAALYWKYKTSKYLDMIKSGWPVLPVKYESLVQYPESNLKIIMKFLDIEWHPNLLLHNNLSHDEVFNGYAVGNTLVSRSIDKNSLYKWKDILSKEQEEAILETAGEWGDLARLE